MKIEEAVRTVTILVIIGTLFLHLKMIEALADAQDQYAVELKKLQDMVLDFSPKKETAE